MWIRIVTCTVLAIIVHGEELLQGGSSGIERFISDGVKSMGYKVVYGDEEMSVINEVVSKAEKVSALKKSVQLNEAMKPLPPQDVKCLMSVDRYCSKEMLDTKSVLIRAVKDDCVDCTIEEKEKAGRVIAAMLAHDQVAWKLFLTRSALQIKKREDSPNLKGLELKEIGEPEEVQRSSRNSFTMPGVKVRVKRYHSELVSPV